MVGLYGAWRLGGGERGREGGRGEKLSGVTESGHRRLCVAPYAMSLPGIATIASSTTSPYPLPFPSRAPVALPQYATSVPDMAQHARSRKRSLYQSTATEATTTRSTVQCESYHHTQVQSCY
eukprot:404478-Rhodomonas_salina.1